MERRFGLATAGLSLCVAGGAVLLMGVARAGHPVLAQGEHPKARLAGAVLLVAMAVLGTGWLAARSRAATLRRFALVGGARRALAREATGELTRELLRLPGVRDARVRLTGSASRARLVLHVLCAEDADLRLLLGLIGEESLVRFRTATDLPDLHAVLRFRLVYTETRIA